MRATLAEWRIGSMEDMNNLLMHEQVELLLAGSARSKEGRQMHRKGARAFAKLIQEHEFPYRTPVGRGHAPFDPECDLMVLEPGH